MCSSACGTGKSPPLSTLLLTALSYTSGVSDTECSGPLVSPMLAFLLEKSAVVLLQTCFVVLDSIPVQSE